MNADLNWHVLYTRPRCESKVANQLRQKGFETFLPCTAIGRTPHQRESLQLQPLFKSWVFVRCTADQLLSLQKCSGVLNIVYWVNQPVIVPSAEILTIKEAINKYRDVRLLKAAIAHFESGEVKTEENKAYFLPSLGYQLDISESQLKVPVGRSFPPAAASPAGTGPGRRSAAGLFWQLPSFSLSGRHQFKKQF